MHFESGCDSINLHHLTVRSLAFSTKVFHIVNGDIDTWYNNLTIGIISIIHTIILRNNLNLGDTIELTQLQLPMDLPSRTRLKTRASVKDKTTFTHDTYIGLGASVVRNHLTVVGDPSSVFRNRFTGEDFVCVVKDWVTLLLALGATDFG
jgi:hypothetical protein